MTAPIGRLSDALADRDRIERELGAGGMDRYRTERHPGTG